MTSSNTALDQLQDKEPSVNINQNTDNSIVNSTDNINEQDILEKLHQIYTSTGLEVDQILKSKERNSIVYISALYEKTRIFGISRENLLRELDNVLTYSLLYTDMGEEEWEECFGNLQSTLPYDINPLEYYYPLALYIHELNCSLEHKPDDLVGEAITCDVLNGKADKLRDERSFNRYVLDMLESSGETELLEQYTRICASNNPEEILAELDMLYLYSQVPRCIPDDEYLATFSALDSTVSEYENIFELYKRLSIFIHLLNCDFEHYVDECDVHVCKQLMKLYEN